MLYGTSSVIAGYWWFSGRILACHAGGPGSIPGQCILFFIFVLFFRFVQFCDITDFLKGPKFGSKRGDNELMSVLNCAFEKKNQTKTVLYTVDK